MFLPNLRIIISSDALKHAENITQKKVMLSKIECVESDINKQEGRTTQIAPIKLEKKQDKSNQVKFSFNNR